MGKKGPKKMDNIKDREAFMRMNFLYQVRYTDESVTCVIIPVRSMVFLC